MKTWTNKDSIKLAKYVVCSGMNELPSRKAMQELLKVCVEEIERLKGNDKEVESGMWFWRCKRCNSEIKRTPCPYCGYGSKYWDKRKGDKK